MILLFDRLAFQALQNLMLETDEWKEYVVRGKLIVDYLSLK